MIHSACITQPQSPLPSYHPASSSISLAHLYHQASSSISLAHHTFGIHFACITHFPFPSASSFTSALHAVIFPAAVCTPVVSALTSTLPAPLVTSSLAHGTHRHCHCAHSAPPREHCDDVAALLVAFTALRDSQFTVALAPVDVSPSLSLNSLRCR